jgi:hypothetical protein
VRVEKQIAETREVLRGPAKSGARRRLLVPALVAIGVMVVLRRNARNASDR